MNEVKIFTQGGLNYDTEEHLLPSGDWMDALNVRMSATDEQLEGIVSNIEGNIRVANYSYNTGTNRCIGAFPDETRGVIYAFIFNGNHHHEIIEINLSENTIIPVFKNMDWTGLVNILGWNPRYKIHSVDVIHRAEDEGDLLFWTDGLGRPRKINVRKAKLWGQPGGYPDPITYDYTTVVKRPPRSANTVWGSDLDRTVNNVRGKLFQFQTRFIYGDYEKSVWSSWSDFSAPNQPFTPDRDSDPTINNYIDVTIVSGDSEVEKIEIGVRQNIESTWGDVYLIETLDKEEKGIGDNTTYVYRFYNDSSGVLQPPAETGQLFDYVPLVAGAQALANGNTLVYGDITEGLGFDGPLDVFMSNEEAELMPMSPGDNFLGYKHSSKYKFGLVYFDEWNRTDGVHNKLPEGLVNRRFEVDTTFYFSDSLGNDDYNIFVPKISAEIFHQPPEWAVTYKWVRTTYMSAKKFIHYLVQPVPTDDIDYLYVWYTRLVDDFVYDGNVAINYDFVPGDRVRFIRKMYGDLGSAENLNIDSEILSVLEDPSIGNDTLTGKFFKIRKNSLTYDFTTTMYLAEIYTPSNIIDTDFYYEFGKTYNIINPGQPNRYHAGMTRDQTASQSAAFVFMKDGDIYYRKRENMDTFKYGQTVEAALRLFRNIPVGAMEYSDKYPSAVSGNGRAYVVDDNAKEQRLPTTIRFGDAYVQDTFINKTNNFQSTNIIDTCDRSYGAIKRLSVRERQLRVYQELKCGWIPIKQQVLQTATGDPIVSQSDRLLNDIQYYLGDFGIGNAACSLASENFVDYFHDTNRGVICRLSNDGITPISIIAKMNRWAVTEDLKYKSPAVLPPGIYPFYTSDYPGYSQIYGVFDTKNNEYISAYEVIAVYDEFQNRTVITPPKTLAWDEVRNRFVTPYGYHPEWMTVHKNDLVTFKNGIPYIHNQKQDGGRCTFYGEEQPWYITLCFNDKFTIKKSYLTLDITSNQAIPVTTIETPLANPASAPISRQQSSLLASDFKWREGHWHASFLRDVNSPGGILNGDSLKGGHIKITLRVEAAQNLISLYSAGVSYIISQKNNE